MTTKTLAKSPEKSPAKPKAKSTAASSASSLAWLDNARILAIFAVIFVHVSVGVPWQAEAGSPLWIYGMSIDALVRWCVPMFVMVSGALLLEPHADESLRDFYKKRVSRVLIPLLFWSLLYIVWGYFRENVQEEFSLTYVVKKLASGKPYYHMWFMFMLAGLYVFTPVFRAVVAGLKTRQLVFFIAMSFGIAAIQSLYEAWYVGESNLFLTWFLIYVPFFLMGHVVRHHDLPISTGKLAVVTACFAVLVSVSLCTVSLNTSHGEAGYFFKNLNILNIFLSVSLAFLFKRMTTPLLGDKLTAAVAPLTFGIYLLHMIPLAYLHDQKEFWGMFSPYVYIPAFSFATLVVTTALVWLISRVPYVRKVV